jgi:hypothetical protein
VEYTDQCFYFTDYIKVSTPISMGENVAALYNLITASIFARSTQKHQVIRESKISVNLHATLLLLL